MICTKLFKNNTFIVSLSCKLLKCPSTGTWIELVRHQNITVKRGGLLIDNIK